MRKNIENLLANLLFEIAELKKIADNQSKEIINLKNHLHAVSMVKIEEAGSEQTESYGNLILDEIVTLKEKIELLTELLTKQANKDVALSQTDNEFSLAELKQELIKLADMMSV